VTGKKQTEQTAEEWLDLKRISIIGDEMKQRQDGEWVLHKDANEALAMARAEERAGIDVIEWSYEKGKQETAKAILKKGEELGWGQIVFDKHTKQYQEFLKVVFND
jgi:hypothetical protein